MNQLCDILKQGRKDKNLTQQQVADLYNKETEEPLTQRAYANYETGDREPDFHTLKILAKVLGVQEKIAGHFLEHYVPQGTPVFNVNNEGKFADYLDKYIKSLEEQVFFYKEKVQLSLTDISNKVTIARAEIRAATEYQVMKDAKNNDHKRKELMGVIDTLIGANLTVDGQKDNFPVRT